MCDAAVQKMMETKKAHANMMLYSAQEASARIMISERKAFRFQKEAEFAKEEAIRMLLRMKQTMDFKMHEAEVLSFKQEKKIVELEGQLEEAERMVRELREELAVCGELEEEMEMEQSESKSNKLANRVGRGSEYHKACHNTRLDAFGNNLESCSMSTFGPCLTFEDGNSSSTLAKRKDESQSRKTTDSALVTPLEDILCIPSILRRSNASPIYSKGIHGLIGNKLRGSKKYLITGSSVIACPAENKDSSFCKKEVLIESATKDIAGSDHNFLEKSLHEEQRKHVEYANGNASLYEHPSTWDLTHRENTGHFPFNFAVNGSSPSGKKMKCPKRVARKVIERSLSTKTCNLRSQTRYVEDKENNALLVKPCSIENTVGNGEKQANVPARYGEEVVQPLTSKGCKTDPGLDIMTCNSNAVPDTMTSTRGSFPFTTNIVQYSRKRSRQARENTASNCDREASPVTVCLKRRASDGTFSLLPDLNSRASNRQSPTKSESESIEQVAHQLLALSDKKWFC